MSQIKKVLSIILVCTMLSAIAPLAILAEDTSVVYLTVENTTFSQANGAPWDGKLLDMAEVEIEEGTTKIVDVIVRGLEENGYSQTGAEMGYISEVNGLGEFDGGFSSGWMLTLNDWFISAGVSEFYVSDGDIVTVMYTSEGFGEDLGGSWTNNNKTITGIEFSDGTLSEEFSSETFYYTLSVSSDTENITITPTAYNKNFQTRIYLNTEFSDGDTGKYIAGEEEFENVLCGLSPWRDIPENIGFYKRTQNIPIQEGDVIAVACGLPYWSSMNSGDFGSGAENEAGNVYFFTVAKEKEEISVDAGVYDYTAVTYKEKNIECEALVSETGIVYETEDFAVEEGTSILDAIKLILNNAQISYALGANDTYITSIGELSETDCGTKSGWIISVNDRFLEESASETILNEDDKIKIHYSVEGWGTDVGNYFTGGPVLKNISLGGVTTQISSNTVYADENDWTGTTTYYIGNYKENGNNTPVEGNGSKESPFIIPLTVGADVDITSLIATVETSLHENYLVVSQEEGLYNILSPVNYENDVTFGIETPGGYKKNYYTLKVKKETVTDSNTEETYIPSRPQSSGSGSSNKKDDDEKEEIKENEAVVSEKTDKFKDIENHWAKECIQRLYNDGVINGKTEESFAPEDEITRAELIALLYRLSNNTQYEITEEFEDVKKDDWYAMPISWAKENGIANGMAQNQFMPNEAVSREQIAVFIVRYCEMAGYEFDEKETIEFKDADDFSDWSYEYILKAQQIGIINGYDDQTFKSKINATRAQTAKMLCNMIDTHK